MSNFFKVNKTFVIFSMVIVLGIFLISVPNVFSGLINQSILDPYNRSVAKDQHSYYSGLSKKMTYTVITNLFSDFVNGYDAGESDNSPEPYCRYGGQYSMDISNDASPGAGKCNIKYDKIFYCKTTQDLINEIKIPESWKNDNLTLYCNDGNSINIKKQNLDFLTSDISNLYKGCILKNLDLNENNTIFYGLEVGNSSIDSNPMYFFNTRNMNALTFEMKIKENITKDNITYIKYDNNYSLIYNITERAFLFSKINEIPKLGINDVFTNKPDIGISRIALFRKYSDGRKIFGYEDAIKFNVNNPITKQDIRPVYHILFNNNFPNTENLCLDSLGYYGARKMFSSNPNSDQKVICGKNTILINTGAIDSKNKKDSLTLFKNIILNIN